MNHPQRDSGSTPAKKAQAAKELVILLISGLVFIHTVGLLGSREASDIPRLFVSAVLCWFLYLGEDWARKLMGLLTAIAALYAAILLKDSQDGLIVTVVLILYTLFYAVTAFLLLTGIGVGPHFSGQKQ